MKYIDKNIKQNCLYCNKEYIKTRATQKYCSKKHASYSSNKREIQRNKEKGIISNKLRIRFEIFKRDDFKCVYCGRNQREDKVKLQIDHIHPSNKGGSELYDKLTTSCFDCNRGKSDILLKDKIIKPSDKNEKGLNSQELKMRNRRAKRGTSL